MFNTKVDKIDGLSTLNVLLRATVVHQYTLMVHASNNTIQDGW